MMEDARQAGVRSLGHARGIQRTAALIGIVVDVEVFGSNRLKIEAAVLHFVLTEVLGGRGRCEDAESQHDNQTTHGTAHDCLAFRAPG